MGYWKWLRKALRNLPRRAYEGATSPFGEAMVGVALLIPSSAVAVLSILRALMEMALNVFLLAWIPIVIGFLLITLGIIGIW